MPDGNKYETSSFYYIKGTGSTEGTWLGSHGAIQEYYDGLTIAYKIPVAGGSSTTTLNITGAAGAALGAKTVYRNASSKVLKQYPVGSVIILTYMSEGSYPGWHCVDYDSNTTYTNLSLGQGYGTCTTEEATTAKAVTMSSYSLIVGGISVVKFTYAVPASATLNINSKGAKSIYYRGAAITAGVIKAGDTVSFIYDGSYYHVISFDRDNNTTYSSKTAASGGTDVSLVTTGEKYTWNNKSDFSGSYNDLTNKPTIPTVNNAKLTLNVGGAAVSGNDAFTANDATDTTYNVPSATASAYGVIKVSSVNSSAVTVNSESTTAGRYYPVELNSDGKAIVNVPWTDTDTNTETTLSIEDKTSTDTTDLVYAVTNLVEGGTKNHTITPTYTGLPTKAYVDNLITNGVEYKGTVSSLTTLHSARMGRGDFVRVSTSFTIGNETAHVGDIILATADSPSNASTTSMGGYDLIHTEVDSNT